MEWLQTPSRLLTLSVMLFLLLATATATTTGNLAMPGCPDKCGNVTIPYPFGFGRPGCYLEDAFEVDCREPNSPRVWAGEGFRVPLLSVSLDGHQLRVLLNASYLCSDSGNITDVSESSFSFSRFVVSDTMTKLFAVGCDGSATVRSSSATVTPSGDVTREQESTCDTKCVRGNGVKGSCTGQGCCNVSILNNMAQFQVVAFPSPNSPSMTRKYFQCNYAFLAEEDHYRFSSFDMSTSSQHRQRQYPVVLDWWVGQEQRCDEARSNPITYACKSDNSLCFEPQTGQGYRCNCSEGFEGNPYVPDGCQDVDECSDPKLNHCINPKTCHNLPGNYTCACPKGKRGDDKHGGTGCVPEREIRWIKLFTGIIAGLVVLFLGICWAYWAVKHRKIVRMREKFFERNGGILLRQQLAKLHGSGQDTLIFSADDLKKATEDYHEGRIIGEGGQGTVYKGTLPDSRTVAIKKAKAGDGEPNEQFINELIVLAQINHRNVVKLLGCCLETEAPLLVYEFVANGALFDHLHDPKRPFVLPWETRLRIAVETASALSYLHSAASIPIIHHDIKSANILLDENFTPKVSDFGASRLIPIDQEQLTTLVRGTMGYLDPEYFHTNHLNEKSDVYSFGVVLLELITGEKAMSFCKSERDRHLVMKFNLAVKEDRWDEVLDRRIMNEGNIEQIMSMADLAMACVRLKGEERPAMREVAAELEWLRSMNTLTSDFS